MKIKDRVSLEEIQKQLIKLKERLKTVKAVKSEGKEFLENIKAYVNDTEYFIKKGEYVLAFESIVWAWAWFEIGERLGFLE